MKVRNLKKDDSEQIRILIENCGPYVAPYNLYAYWMLENYYYSTCKVVEEDDKIIGFVSGMPNIDKSSMFIWQICVDKEYRGNGVATLLLDSLLKRAKELKFEKIELSISEGNIVSQKLFKSFSKKNSLELKEKKKFKFKDVNEIVYMIEIG